eukprot:1725416-Prymnesium_polylepis.1
MGCAFSSSGCSLTGCGSVVEDEEVESPPVPQRTVSTRRRETSRDHARDFSETDKRETNSVNKKK